MGKEDDLFKAVRHNDYYKMQVRREKERKKEREREREKGVNNWKKGEKF